jgi:hypothetical protein
VHQRGSLLVHLDVSLPVERADDARVHQLRCLRDRLAQHGRAGDGDDEE